MTDTLTLIPDNGTTNVATEPDPQPAPSKFLLPSNFTTVTDSATKLLAAAAGTKQFFRRDTGVVRVVGNGDTAFLERLSTHGCRSAFEVLGEMWRLRRNRQNQVVPERVAMTADHANQVLNCSDAVRLLPEILGTINVPLLANTPRGPQLYEGGFVPELGIYILDGFQVPAVPVDVAVRSLRGLLAEFQFSSPSDESRAFAGFITPMLHFGNWLPGEPVPVDVAEADQSQAGKTFRQKIIAAMYRALPAYVNMKKGGVGGQDESIQSLIFSGKPFICIDNSRGETNSEFLEQTITNTTGLYRIRLPYAGEVEVRAKFLVMLSSNDAKMTKDLANRSVVTRIRKRIGYEYLTNPLAMVEKSPEHYLGCVVAIVREWANQGRPRTSGANHDFRAWAGSMDWIVQNIAKLPPLLEGHKEVQSRAADPMMGALRSLAFAVDEMGECEKQLSAARMLEIASVKGIEIPGVDTKSLEEGSKADAYRQLGVKLKPVFKEAMSVTIDQFTITRSEDTKERDGGKGPLLVKQYCFTKSNMASTHAAVHI